MLRNLVTSMKSRNGKYIISILLGLGIASLFRKSCGDKKCITFKGPSLKKMKNIYGYDNKCYKFVENSITCNSRKKQINFA